MDNSGIGKFFLAIFVNQYCNNSELSAEKISDDKNYNK